MRNVTEVEQGFFCVNCFKFLQSYGQKAVSIDLTFSSVTLRIQSDSANSNSGFKSNPTSPLADLGRRKGRPQPKISSFSIGQIIGWRPLPSGMAPPPPLGNPGSATQPVSKQFTAMPYPRTSISFSAPRPIK